MLISSRGILVQSLNFNALKINVNIACTTSCRQFEPNYDVGYISTTGSMKSDKF